MTHFTIRFTRQDDSGKDRIANMHKIYRDIVGRSIKGKYEVPMGGLFLRSEAERIIGEFQNIISENTGRFVKSYSQNLVLACGLFGSYDPYLADVTYHLTYSSE